MSANPNNSEAHSNHSHHAEIGWQWPIICGSGLLVMILGIIGFMQPTEGNAGPVGLLDALYDSLQLFHLHLDYAGRPLPWELQVARFLAPLVVGFTIVKFFMSVAHRHHRAFLHRTKCNHVVICGLGRKGLQLAKKFRELGSWVVVIEKDANNGLLQECEDENILCWIGDAGHRSQLKKARVECAKLVIAVTGDDGKNVEVAMRTAELCAGSKNAPQCFVHIVDPQLRNLFREHRILTEPGDSHRAAIFDFYENCALALFQEHALDGESGSRSATRCRRRCFPSWSSFAPRTAFSFRLLTSAGACRPKRVSIIARCGFVLTSCGARRRSRPGPIS